MIPIPISWTQYTATFQGRRLKAVPCENCSTEYFYVLERECTGVGTTMYSLDKKGAASHATSAAGDTLQTVLENDFDPVPCPVCGHYQRFMFPKLVESKWPAILVLRLSLTLAGCLVAASALYRSVLYFLTPSDSALLRMITSWSVLLLLFLLGLGLTFLHRHKVRCFDPNREDQQARIALGRSRAITRAELEKAQQENKQD